MFVNHKLYKTILVGSGIVITAGYGISAYIQPEDPAFFTHYYSLQASNTSGYQSFPEPLRYVTSIHDDRTVVGISFPDYPDISLLTAETPRAGINWTNNGTESSRRQYGPYSVREVWLETNMMMEEPFQENTILSEAEIHFDDSSTMTVDLGAIEVHKPSLDSLPVERTDWTFNEGEWYEVTYSALEDITFESINSALYEQMGDRVSIQVNGVTAQQAEGLLIESGDTLTVSVEKSTSETPLEGSAYLNTEPTLTVSTSEGTSYHVSLFNRYTHYPEHEMIDLYRLLNTGEGDGHDENS